MTPDDLRERYAAFNAAWFDRRLVRVRFRVSGRMTSTAGQYDLGKREITIARRFLETFPEKIDGLLLHEMVHVATRDGHGAKFRREWERLRAIGAPVPDVYEEFRHCPQFAEARPRPYVYVCPACGEEFPRVRPFAESRWCAGCVRQARRRGENPFAPGHRLQRVPAQQRLFAEAT